MMGKESSCLQYLRDLFTAIKSFYHPSNTGDFQQELVSFLSKLSQAFVDRVHLYVELYLIFSHIKYIIENGNLIAYGISIHLNRIDLQKRILLILLIVFKNVYSFQFSIKLILKKLQKHVKVYHNSDRN
jgi:hypothetical protein